MQHETALKLVDSIEYNTAEASTQATRTRYQLARELDVTLQVIQDYQRLLDSNATTPIRFPESLIA